MPDSDFQSSSDDGKRSLLDGQNGSGVDSDYEGLGLSITNHIPVGSPCTATAWDEGIVLLRQLESMPRKRLERTLLGLHKQDRAKLGRAMVALYDDKLCGHTMPLVQSMIARHRKGAHGPGCMTMNVDEAIAFLEKGGWAKNDAHPSACPKCGNTMALFSADCALNMATFDTILWLFYHRPNNLGMCCLGCQPKGKEQRLYTCKGCEKSFAA